LILKLLHEIIKRQIIKEKSEIIIGNLNSIFVKESIKQIINEQKIIIKILFLQSLISSLQR